MAVLINQTFDALVDCNDDFILYSSRFGGDNEAQTSVNANGGYWCWTDAGSASSGTGPPSGTACMHSETSSPSAAGDVFYAVLRSDIDATAWDVHTVTFNTCMQGNTAGTMYFEAYNGATWDIIDSWIGDATTTFTARGPYDFGPNDLDYTNDDFNLRFRIVTGGTSYQNDFAVDTFYVEATAKATAEVDQQSFRGYEDGTEAGASPIEAQGDNFEVTIDDIFHIRFLLQATDDPDAALFRVDYREASDADAEYRPIQVE